MIVKPNYLCTCGHMAGAHEQETKSIDLGGQEPVVITTKVYGGRCQFDKANIPPTPLSEGVSGYGYDYTNFGRWCTCQTFKLDNLKYLEQEADGR